MNGKTVFFQKARPVWETGKEEELNITLAFLPNARAANPRSLWLQVHRITIFM